MLQCIQYSNSNTCTNTIVRTYLLTGLLTSLGTKKSTAKPGIHRAELRQTDRWQYLTATAVEATQPALRTTHADAMGGGNTIYTDISTPSTTTQWAAAPIQMSHQYQQKTSITMIATTAKPHNTCENANIDNTYAYMHTNIAKHQTQRTTLTLILTLRPAKTANHLIAY